MDNISQTFEHRQHHLLKRGTEGLEIKQRLQLLNDLLMLPSSELCTASLVEMVHNLVALMYQLGQMIRKTN